VKARKKAQEGRVLGGTLARMKLDSKPLIEPQAPDSKPLGRELLGTCQSLASPERGKQTHKESL
jgi:hypothetical protein